MLGRRDFVTLLSGAAISWPMAARGSSPAVLTAWVIE
jgi:hypothetical protein